MSARFSKFDRIILGAVFIGILMVGIGVIIALQKSDESLTATKDIAQKTDRNFNVSVSNFIDRQITDQKRGNTTIGIILPVLLDIDEDVEQIKTALNISRGTQEDLLIMNYNGSHLDINNATTILVPNFRELLGVQNLTGTANVLGNTTLPINISPVVGPIVGAIASANSSR